MKLQEWKHLFRDIIVARGIDYYSEGKVLEIKKDRNVYRAVVEGEKKYCVQILMHNKKILGAYCDCPYAIKGERCKHMVATLLAIEAKENEA